MKEIRELKSAITRFADERNWKQFHNPKNLVMALSVEVAEIMEHLQWLTPEESMNLDQDKKTRIEQEIGDVFIYLLRLCDILEVDPVIAAREKMKINSLKYPVEKAKDNAKKYNEF